MRVCVRVGGDAEECVHTDEVASELNVGSLTAAVGLPDRNFLQDLMRRRSWLQEHWREKQVGGGDPGGGGGVLLAESHDSRVRRGRGSAARCLEAGPASTGKLGLPGPKNPTHKASKSA